MPITIIEPPPALPPAEMPALESSTQQEEQQHHQHDDAGGVDGPEQRLPSDSESMTQKTASRRESEGFVAFNKGFGECEVTPEPTNPVKKDTTTKGGRVNLSPTTPLKGIAGQSVQVLKIDDLRMFCSRNGIKGSRKAKKADICWAICTAKEQYLAGDAGPYRDLIPGVEDTGGGNENHGGGGAALAMLPGGAGGEASALAAQVSLPVDEAWMGGDANIAVDSERANKKRRVEDATLSLTGEEGMLALPPLLPTKKPSSTTTTNITTAKQQWTKSRETENNQVVVMDLHRRLVQSKEDTNLAIQLREMVESAASLRRELREEKDRRATLWKEIVETVGDESLATTRVKDYKATMMQESDNGGDGAAVKGSYETLVENVIEQDDLVRKMGVQHAALSKAIDQLIPKEKNDSIDGGSIEV
ncbi:hypothetical protein ACHAXR_010198 [Thalassiosira sp. AJA248-18]